MPNVYAIITEKIIEQLEKGVIPWRKPWRTISAQNLLSRKEYRGINSILLNSLPFENPYFLTFKQARLLGGFVRYGERGFPVIFWQVIEKGEGKDKETFPVLRYYTVFNIGQCAGIEVPKTQIPELNPIEECERIVTGMPNAPKIRYGGNTASYSPQLDLVNVPNLDRFTSAQEFYSTTFHELTHSTGHETRLNRKGITEALHFASENYSKEELIAELGASFLNAKAGISSPTLSNSSSYIANWLSILRSDKRMVIEAAGQAQKATDYIIGVQTLRETE